MTDAITVYVSIGNSDGKLTQPEWSKFCRMFRDIMTRHATQIYGDWLSSPDSRFQNGCIAAVIPVDKIATLRMDLMHMRAFCRQDLVAWAEVTATELI